MPECETISKPKEVSLYHTRRKGVFQQKAWLEIQDDDKNQVIYDFTLTLVP